MTPTKYVYITDCSNKVWIILLKYASDGIKVNCCNTENQNPWDTLLKNTRIHYDIKNNKDVAESLHLNDNKYINVTHASWLLL